MHVHVSSARRWYWIGNICKNEMSFGSRILKSTGKDGCKEILLTLHNRQDYYWMPIARKNIIIIFFFFKNNYMRHIQMDDYLPNFAYVNCYFLERLLRERNALVQLAYSPVWQAQLLISIYTLTAEIYFINTDSSLPNVNDYIYVWYISECRVRDQGEKPERFFFLFSEVSIISKNLALRIGIPFRDNPRIKNNFCLSSHRTQSVSNVPRNWYFQFRITALRSRHNGWTRLSN